MRAAFIDELLSQARLNQNIFLIVGDLGFSVVEPFIDEFPDRFLNAGIAEQNMTGVAAGLASEGYHVFTYSIANFPTLRCLEQIRNDVCYHNLPVTVVAVGGGLAYGNLGYSHHAVQDLAILRSLGNIRIFSPADPAETKSCVQRISQNPGPSYLRLGRAGELVIHRQAWKDGLITVRSTPGAAAAFVATGAVLKEAVAASDLLLRQDIHVNVYSCPQVHPVTADLINTLSEHTLVMVVEEHVRAGGLYSCLCENVPRSVELMSACVDMTACGVVGSQSYLWARTGLGAAQLAQRLSDRFNKMGPSRSLLSFE